MLISWRLWIYSLVKNIIPETRCFGLKRAFLRWCGAKVGINVRVCSSASFLGCGDLEIGNDTWIGHQCLIVASAQVKIGECVDIAPQVYIGTGTHMIDGVRQHSAGEGENIAIIIENGCWLGARSIVLPGVHVGKKAVVAAGAVVAKDIVPHVMVGGVPAKLIKVLQ